MRSTTTALEPEQATAASPSPTADRPLPHGVAIVAIAATCGYLAIGRGFAHIGFAPLFLGEALLLLALVYPRTRVALQTALADLFRPSVFHVLTWVVVITFAYGAFQVVYGIQLGYRPMTVLQTSAFSFYVVFLFLGLWAGRSLPGILERMALAARSGQHDLRGCVHRRARPPERHDSYGGCAVERRTGVRGRTDRPSHHPSPDTFLLVARRWERLRPPRSAEALPSGSASSPLSSSSPC